MKYILLLFVTFSIYSCENHQRNESQIEQAYIQKIDSLEKELTNYKALYEVAKGIIESDSSIIKRN